MKFLGSVAAALALAAATALPASRPPLRGAFFDFDGTLVQSEDAHRRRFAQVLGRDISPDEWFARCVGHHPPRIVRILLGDELDDAALAEHCAALEAAVPAFAETIEPTRGARALLDALRARGVPCAVVSSSSAAVIARVLARLGLDGYFAHVIGGDDDAVPAPKPDAAPYLAAAARLGVACPECIAFEDSPAGLEAAHAAGCGAVVALANPANARETALLARSAAIVDDFDGVDLATLYDDGAAAAREDQAPSSAGV